MYDRVREMLRRHAAAGGGPLPLPELARRLGVDCEYVARVVRRMPDVRRVDGGVV